MDVRTRLFGRRDARHVDEGVALASHGFGRGKVGRALVATVVGGTLAVSSLAACGSSSSSSSGDASSSSSAPAKSEIRLGVIGGFSGALASTLGIVPGIMTAWADSVNASGGINGHPVKLFIEDDNSNAQTSVTLMKKLVEQDKVVAIVGQGANAGSSAWATYVSEKGIPVIGGNGSDPSYLSDPNFYSVTANSIAYFYGIAAVAKNYGPKFGALYCAESPACAQVVPILNGFGQGLGVSVTYSNKIAASSPDFTAACQGLKSAGVQSYSLSVAGPVLKRIAAQCQQQGLSAKLITAVADASYIGAPGLEGVQVVDANYPFWDTSTPAAKAFHDALAKYDPSLGTDSNPLTYIAPRMWASGKLVEAAIKASGTDEITSDSIKKGLYSLKDETLGGLTPPLNFVEGKPHLLNCYFVYTITDGKFTAPGGVKPTCAPDAVVTGALSKK